MQDHNRRLDRLDRNTTGTIVDYVSGPGRLLVGRAAKRPELPADTVPFGGPWGDTPGQWKELRSVRYIEPTNGEAWEDVYWVDSFTGERIS